MVLVASLWNRGPSMNYVASFSWFLPLPSPYHYFFPTVHHQTFLHFSTLPLLTNVDIIFGRPSSTGNSKLYESYRSQQVWARYFHWSAIFFCFFYYFASSVFDRSPLINDNVIYGRPQWLEIANYESYRSQQVWARQFHWWANFVAWHRGAEFGAGGNRKVLGKVGTWTVSPFEGVNYPDVAPVIEINHFQSPNFESYEFVERRHCFHKKY